MPAAYAAESVEYSATRGTTTGLPIIEYMIIVATNASTAFMNGPQNAQIKRFHAGCFI